MTPPWGSHPEGPLGWLRMEAREAPVVVTVRVAVAALLPAGMTDAGLKLHVTPRGRLDASQPKETCS